MEYGLRRYEAVQRLLWFLFFLLCLIVAYPFGKAYQSSVAGAAAVSPGLGPGIFKSSAFWMRLDWLRVDSLLTFAIIYLVWVAILFLGGRLIWLLTQNVGKHLVRALLSSTVKKPQNFSNSSISSLPANFDRLFPTELLLKKANRFPLRFLFHPYQRLRLMLGNTQGAPSSEELIERERRIVETDWQILMSTWTPFRWLIWCLPLLGLLESSWLLHLHLQPVVTGQKELQDIFGSIAESLVPLVQMVAATVAFNLISGLQKRLETLYLSDVDALFYDQFLSRLPFQSSDTVILLEAMQRHFRDLQHVLRRIERSMGGAANGKESTGRES